MTHPKEAVEAVARAMYAERSTRTTFENAYPELRAIYDTRATSLLDQIAPLYREQAARGCEVEADKCDDAAKWGGSKRYVQDCKAAAYALRDRAFGIRKGE